MPGHWACKCGRSVSQFCHPDSPASLLLCIAVVILSVRAGTPWRTKPTNREHQVGNQENLIFPESRVCPPPWRPQIHFPCSSSPSQPVGVHILPSGTGKHSTSPTTHPCVRGSFPTAHKHCMEVVVKSYQTQDRAQFWTVQLHKSTDVTFVTAPFLHLTKCWLSFGVAASSTTAPLLAQALIYGFRGTPAPLETQGSSARSSSVSGY